MNDDKKAKKQVLDLEFDDMSELDESTFDIGVDATNTAVLGVNAPPWQGFKLRHYKML